MSEVMARALLSSVGLKPEDVQYVTVSTAGRVQALVTGTIDAAPLHIDQYYLALKMKPDLKVVANLWDIVPKWWYSAYMVTDAQLKDPEERKALVAFETAIIKAQRFIYQNRDETIAIAVKYTNEDKEAVTKSYDDLAKGGIWAVNDGLGKDIVEYTVDKQIEIGTFEKNKKPTYESFIDSSLAEEALKKLGGKMTGDPRWN
jgi:ABC-type nitrate/sulfonate/bicarbonate transport system substrate-binding protein